MAQLTDISNRWAQSRVPLVRLARAVNQTLDAVFYDLSALSAAEREHLSSYRRPEGSILVVQPQSSAEEIRTLTPAEFVQEQSGRRAVTVDAIAVAGVGSSALGTAALARNVADAVGRPVAGVVAGQGLADLMTEALGGWFVLGARNAVRDGLARAFDAVGFKDHVRDAASHEDIGQQFAASHVDRDRFIYGSPDSTTLLYLLLKLGGGIRLLVGHSKGNYSIENALEGWVSSGTGAGGLADVCIVTLGAVIRFPEEFTNVHQFIGRADLFGMMNSRFGLDHETVPWAWHSLNARLPGHLGVAEALQVAGAV